MNKISDYIQKFATLEHEDINEEIKAKFLYRLVREIRRHMEN